MHDRTCILLGSRHESTLFLCCFVAITGFLPPSPTGASFFCHTLDPSQKQAATTVAAKGKKHGNAAERAAQPTSDNTPGNATGSSPRAPFTTTASAAKLHNKRQPQQQQASATTDYLLDFNAADANSTSGAAGGKLNADILEIFSTGPSSTSDASAAPAGSVAASAAAGVGQGPISSPNGVADPAADASAEISVDSSLPRASVVDGHSQAQATSTLAGVDGDTELSATPTVAIVDGDSLASVTSTITILDGGTKTAVTSAAATVDGDTKTSVTGTSASVGIYSEPPATSTKATVHDDSDPPATSTAQTPVAVPVLPPDNTGGEMLRGWTRTSSADTDNGNSANKKRSERSNRKKTSGISLEVADAQEGVGAVLSFEASGAADRVADRFREKTRAAAAAGAFGERGPVLWAKAALRRCQGDEKLAVDFVEIRTVDEMEAFVLGDTTEESLKNESEEMERHRVWFWQVCFVCASMCCILWKTDECGMDGCFHDRA